MKHCFVFVKKTSHTSVDYFGKSHGAEKV